MDDTLDLATEEELLAAKEGVCIKAKSHSTPFIEVPHPKYGGTTLRTPTRKELKDAVEYHREHERLRDLMKKAAKDYEDFHAKCTCVVSIDEFCSPYDFRNCFACGRSKGTV